MINSSALDKIKNSKRVYIFLTIACIAYLYCILIIKSTVPSILTISFALVFSFLVFKNIKYGIIGFIIVSIFPNIQSRQIFGLTGLNAMNIIFFAVILRYFLDFLKKESNYKMEKLPILKGIIFIFILQFIFWLRLICMKGPYYKFYYANPFLALNGQFLKPLEYYIILYLIYKSINTKKDLKIYFYYFYLATFIGMIYLFMNYVILKVDPYSWEMWSNVFAGHKNVFGITAAIMSLVSISFYLHVDDYKMKLLIMCGGIISSFVLIYSLSRNAWASFLMALLYLLYKEKKMKAFFIPFFISLILILTPLSNIVIKRASRGLESGNLNEITAGRFGNQWANQWKGIKKNPIIGGGEIALLHHSGYLTIWNKQGILGLIITFIILYKMLKLFLVIFTNKAFVGITKAFSLAGLSLVVLVLFANIAGDFQIVGKNMHNTFLIMFIYISSFRLFTFKKEKEANNKDEIMLCSFAKQNS
ncbi:MAG: O-antigen ligase family protein [Promethearchaeota archaeon]